MQIIIVLYFFAIGLAALIAQMVLPAHFPLLSAIGAGSALVPLVVIYASMELADERAPVLAGILGLMLDLYSNHRLGISALVLATLSALIVTQAARRESQQWVFRLMFVLVGTFAFLVLDYLLCQFQTARWTWPLGVWSRITLASLLNLLLSPLCFLVAGLPPRLCGWRPAYEINERHRTYASD